jgi:hypothetical protein
MDRHTRQSSLVDDTGAKLEKRPTMERGALRPSSPDPRANVRQILQRYRSLRAFGLRHDLLAEGMVHPGGEPSFLACQTAQTPPAALRPESLQLPAQPAIWYTSS